MNTNNGQLLTNIQRLIIIHSILNQNPLQQLNDEEYLQLSSISQSDCQDDPFQIHHYGNKYSSHSDLMMIKSAKKKMIQDKILEEFSRKGNLKYMKKLQEDITQEQFILDKLIQTQTNKLEITRMIEASFNNKIKDVNMKVRIQSTTVRDQKYFNSRNIQSSSVHIQTEKPIKKDSGTNYDINLKHKNQKDKAKQENIADKIRRKNLWQSSCYSISIINCDNSHKNDANDTLQETQIRLPYKQTKINNQQQQQYHSQYNSKQQKQNQHNFQLQSQKDKNQAYKINKIQKLQLPLLPANQPQRQITTIYQQLEKQVKYYQFLQTQKKQNGKNNKKIQEEQKRRVKYCMQRYWKTIASYKSSNNQQIMHLNKENSSVNNRNIPNKRKTNNTDNKQIQITIPTELKNTKLQGKIKKKQRYNDNSDPE